MRFTDDAGARPPFLTLAGLAAAPGRACGPLARSHDGRSANELAGRVWVAERAVPEDVPRILAASGTLTLGGALLSHVTLLSRELGRPSVSLRADLRARLVPEGDGTALVELGGLVGGGRSVLHEGDVVLIDGDAGTVSVPGGLDRACQRSVAETWTALTRWSVALDPPGLADLVERVASRVDPLLDFVLEAGVSHARIASGGPARELMRTLVERLGATVVDRGIRALRARRRAEIAAVLDRLAGAIDEAGGADELDQVRSRVDAERGRWATLIADVGHGDDDVGRRFDDAARSIDRRRSTLRAAVAAAVEVAAREPDELLRRRTGTARRLIRRADSLGIADPAVARLRGRIDRIVDVERERTGGSFIVPLRVEEGAARRSCVGGKAAGLLRALAALPAGTVVPAGFVVTSAAYRCHLAGEVGERLREAVESAAGPDTLARAARGAILAWDIPPEVAGAVSDAVAPFADAPLAVRSSADIEDEHDGSLAGQFDSWLGIRGGAGVLDRLRWCWASLWNARALRTLAASGRSPLAAVQAVLVQEVVETRAAGVMATRDPSGRADVGLINAAWGLGEAVSQGTAPGDLYWFRRSEGSIVDREISAWGRRIVLDPGGAGTIETELPPERTGRPCLDADDVRRLAELARALEATFAEPLDVEFGFDPAGRLCLFQVRPLARAALR